MKKSKEKNQALADSIRWPKELYVVRGFRQLLAPNREMYFDEYDDAYEYFDLVWMTDALVTDLLMTRQWGPGGYDLKMWQIVRRSFRDGAFYR